MHLSLKMFSALAAIFAPLLPTTAAEGSGMNMMMLLEKLPYYKITKVYDLEEPQSAGPSHHWQVASVQTGDKGVPLSQEPWLEHNPSKGTVLVLLGESDFLKKASSSGAGAVVTNGLGAGAVKTAGAGAVNTGGSGAVNTAGSGAVKTAVTGAINSTGQAVAVQAVAQHNNATQQSTQAAAGTAQGAAKQIPELRKPWFSFLRYGLSFAFILKALCISSNIFYQATPITTVRKFTSKGDTGDLDLAPFISCAYGGWQWCFYGLFAYLVTHKGGFLVLVYSNCVGATLGLYYVFAFQQFCKNTKMLQRASTYYYVLATIVGVQAGAIAVLPPVRALFFCGLVSSAWSIIGSMSLLTTVPDVWRTRNSASLQLPLLIIGETSAALWVCCGLMLWDPWITLPNGFSFFACFYAHTLCMRYPPPQGMERQTSSDTQDGAPDASDLASCHSAAFSPVSRSASPNLETKSPQAPHLSPWPLTRALNLVRGHPSSSSPLMAHREEPTMETCLKYGSDNYGAMPSTGGTGDSW